MGENWPGKTVPVNGPGNIPDVAQLKALMSQQNYMQTNLIKDGAFEVWTGGTSVAPDNWTLNGASAAVARVADPKRGTYAAKITYGVADSFLDQSVTAYADFTGRAVKAWVWVKCSTASIARIKINDGVGVSASSYHTGGGSYELLQVEHTVDGTPTELTIELHVENTGDATFDAAMLVDFHDAVGFIPHVSEILAVDHAVTEGTLASRSASPAEKTLYFDTENEVMYFYSLTNATWYTFLMG